MNEVPTPASIGLSREDLPNSYIGRSVPRPNVPKLVQGRATYVDDLVLPRMLHAALESVRRTRTRLGPALARLDTLSPLAILSRGYSLTWRLPERTLVRDAQELAPGDKIYLRFGTGGATAAVEGVEENAGGPLEPGPDAVEGDTHG